MLDGMQSGLQKGVRNLLFNCGSCTAGDTVLIVFEMDDSGYYDPHLAPTVEACAADLGLKVEMFGVAFAPDVADPDDALSTRMAAADCTLFLARLGDQIRFRTKDASMTQVISYALDCDMLASPFGTTPYQAFEDLKKLVNGALSAAEDIHVTCPRGTDFRGRVTNPLSAEGDVTRKRFPVSVNTPICASSFSGRIAQGGFLTGTGSNYYQPYTRGLRDTLFVEFENSHIKRFDGHPEDVAAARSHYEFVGQKYGIDTYFVHSWHAGIHPGCHYPQAASQNFERWGNGAFGNPRLIHFHTCGAYPPGEISLNVLDATIRLNGIPVWKHGGLQPDLIAGGTELLDSIPEMRALFNAPSMAVGQGPNNQLCFA